MNDLTRKQLVTIGIVTWNSAADLPGCLDALQKQDYPDMEIVIVDNASTDSSVQIVQECLPTALLIRNTANRGYCGGHNQGINASCGAYYLPLNPDVILEPGFVSAMVGAIQMDSGFGMVAACLYQDASPAASRRFDSTGLFIDRTRRQYLRGFQSEDRGQYSEMEEVFGVDGAAPLYSRAMLEDIKIDGQYFDEAFHSHKEDVDLAWRARLFGWRCIYTPHAVGYHKRTFRPGSRKNMVGDVKLHAVKNRYLILLKNESRAGWHRDWLHILFYDIKIIGYMILFERSSLKAFKLTKSLWNRALSWRKEILRRSRIADYEQVNWFHS